MERIGHSWQLVKSSWRVLRADKELIVFPIVSTVLTLLVMALFALPILNSGAPERWSNEGYSVVDLVLAFLFYLVTYTVVIFCNAALVGAAEIRLKGGDPTLGDGFRIAFHHVPAIVGWAVVSATVGMVLRALSDRGGIVGSIVAAIAGVAWSLVTFLVIPVLVIEGVGPVAALKRSGGLLRQTWGEQVVGTISIGLVMGLAVAAVAIIGGFATAALIAVAFPIGVLAAIVLVVVLVGMGLLGSALSGIFTVALYRYATTGDAGTFFSEDTMRGAFRTK
jgi:hypothetical protein